jgi:hypothetical protein
MLDEAVQVESGFSPATTTKTSFSMRVMYKDKIATSMKCAAMQHIKNDLERNKKDLTMKKPRMQQS